MGVVYKQSFPGAAGTAVSTAVPAIITDSTGGGAIVIDGNGNCSLGTNAGASLFHDTTGQITRAGGAVSGSLTLGSGCDAGIVLRQVNGSGYYLIDLSGASTGATTGYVDKADGNGLGSFAAETPYSGGSANDTVFSVAISLTSSTIVLTIGGGSTPTRTFTDSSLAGPFYVGWRNGGGGTNGPNGGAGGGQPGTGARIVGTYTASDPSVATALAPGTIATGTPTASTVPLTLSGTTGGTTPYSVQFQQAPDASGSPGTFANLGSAGTASTATATGLTASTPYWFRAVVTDSASSPATQTTPAVTATTSTTSVPAFTLALAPATLNLAQGATTSTTVTVTPSGGFTGTVILSTGGLPACIGGSFSPATVPGGGTSTLTLAASDGATLGASALTVLGTSGSLAPSVAGSLTIGVGTPAVAPLSSTVALAAADEQALALALVDEPAILAATTALRTMITNLAAQVAALPAPLNPAQTTTAAQNAWTPANPCPADLKMIGGSSALAMTLAGQLTLTVAQQQEQIALLLQQAQASAPPAGTTAAPGSLLQTIADAATAAATAAAGVGTSTIDPNLAANIAAVKKKTDALFVETSTGAVIISAAGLETIQVEPGINLRQALAPILAATTGAVTGAGATGNGTAVVIAPQATATPAVQRLTCDMLNGTRTNVKLTLPTVVTPGEGA